MLEFTLFINAATVIAVQLFKIYIPKKLIPLSAVLTGLVLGIFYAVFYQGDVLTHGFYGAVFGASATGIYKTVKDVEQEEKTRLEGKGDADGEIE